MKLHTKKMIAPIVVTIIVILYFFFYFGFLIGVLNGIFKYLLFIIPAVFSALIIAVCFERIKEIKGGEEDDISKY